MRKNGNGVLLRLICKPIKKITLSSFLKITKTQNTTQSLENIIIIFLDKKGSLASAAP